MSRVISACFIAIFLIAPAQIFSQTLAFPGADGFGKYTTGGRGGDVYFVTNLNNSGPGSLRDGVEQSGPRIIVFGISGTIELTEDLRIRNDDISIFGQTAPGEGIAIKGRSTVIDADNVIIQYVRFRPGDIGTGNLDGLDALWGRENTDIIIDHVSLSWSVDETGSFYDNTNFTLQWSILSESMWNSVHSKSEHGYGGIWGGSGATFHHNLLAHHTSRNPRFNGARYTTTPETEKADYRNNVIYNWGGNSAYGGENGNYNMVANYYKPGPATPNGQKKYRILDAEGNGQWYIEDNYVVGYPKINENNWVSILEDDIQAIQSVQPSQFEDFRSLEPIEAPELTSFQTAEEAYLSVLDNAGAILPRRDTIDARIVHETRTGTATFGGSFGAGTGIIDSQNDVGGWPELLSTSAPLDTDKDGIPDEWEEENDLDPNNAADGKVINETGYSNLESYIQTLDTVGEFIPVPGTLKLNYPVSESSVSVSPEFNWTTASSSLKYQIEIRDGAGDFANVILDSTVTETTFNYPNDSTALENNKTYFWRVRGINDQGTGPWAEYEYFVTQVATSNEGETTTPIEFGLFQNYPNPFNPSTKIQFSLSKNAFVSIKIYDIVGREVSTLVNEYKVYGVHSVEFNAEGMASGIYVYQINVRSETSSFSETKRMTLIK